MHITGNSSVKKINVKFLRTPWEKFTGLIGQKNIYPIFFKTHFGIHTFGMKTPIDVLVLDKTNHVVALKTNLLPNHLFFWNPVYEKVLELPYGEISKNNIAIQTFVRINLL
jgi:uncharacterized membrane protein (UPF0127 family)